MRITETALEGVYVIEYEDRRQTERGGSFTLFDTKALKDKAGTLYGIHCQTAAFAADRVFFCLRGRGIDYAVDLRRGSQTFLRWISVDTSAENGRQLYIPRGFGHAFIALEDGTENIMLSTAPISSQYRCCIRYDDPRIGIEYPDIPPILARHDLEAPYLSEDFAGL